MATKHVLSLSIVVIAVAGCVTKGLPPFSTKPEPPIVWDISHKTRIGCPDVTGRFVIIPEVATYQDNGEWFVTTGNRTDYILLFPFGRAGVDGREFKDTSSKYSSKNLIFDLNAEEGKMLIISPIKDTDNFTAHTFVLKNGDYECEVGNIVFPEFQIHGATEGGFLRGRIYRRATITAAGDFIFYEQVQGNKTIHKYYLFKLRKS